MGRILKTMVSLL